MGKGRVVGENGWIFRAGCDHHLPQLDEVSMTWRYLKNFIEVDSGLFFIFLCKQIQILSFTLPVMLCFPG